ncbi:four helix bundle protein [Pedobacter chitinilyticus]|uniref:Four helix bundle protein n=1 Tax=Pedobacter chitinilyticus TaxID=2233776 RepID=A0A443YRI8_9SPHI|nr:four helix bundle protein [Pedobacter chitinilyticus]RWU06418.1 four helix bundle protein [Pedobacter chitinilyticus]
MEKEKKAYVDLEVWKEARALANNIYQATKLFPKEEIFGLVSQMRRCAVSIPSNIAEGCGRNHPKDSVQFFFIARGSIYELETQLYISFDQGYIDEITMKSNLQQLETTRKLLNGFIKYYQQLIK